VVIGHVPRRMSTSRSLLRQHWVAQMDQDADEARNRTANHYTILGKRTTNDYNIYMSYYRGDNEGEVLEIVERLTERGCLPWMDIREYVNGYQPSETQMIADLSKCKYLAFCIGEQKTDARQRKEMELFLKLERPIIPVILPSAPRDVKMLPNLKRLDLVDFRNPKSRPLEQLIYSINDIPRR
jgi:hypothetical protein